MTYNRNYYFFILFFNLFNKCVYYNKFYYNTRRNRFRPSEVRNDRHKNV